MIKRHQDTGLKYLHYTNREDDSKYLGSGTHWKHHLKKHGTNVISCLVLEGDNQKLMTNYALYMSEELDIVNSKDWANLIPEDCLQGGTAGMSVARDKDGNTFQVNKDDSRYLTGEITHANSGEYNGRYGETGGMYVRTPKQNQARSVAAVEYAKNNLHPMKGKKQPKSSGGNHPGSIKIRLERWEFDCLQDAINATGLDVNTIHKYIDDIRYPECRLIDGVTILNPPMDKSVWKERRKLNHSLASKGKKHPGNTGSNNKSSIKVNKLCLKTGKILETYDSQSAARKATKADVGSVVRGRQKSSGGFGWERA